MGQYTSLVLGSPFMPVQGALGGAGTVHRFPGPRFSRFSSAPLLPSFPALQAIHRYLTALLVGSAKAVRVGSYPYGVLDLA